MKLIEILRKIRHFLINLLQFLAIFKGPASGLGKAPRRNRCGSRKKH